MMTSERAFAAMGYLAAIKTFRPKPRRLTDVLWLAHKPLAHVNQPGIATVAATWCTNRPELTGKGVSA